MTHDQKKQKIIDELIKLGNSILSEAMIIDEDGFNLDSYCNIDNIARRLLIYSKDIFDFWIDKE